jgi:hypothetical protein
MVLKLKNNFLYGCSLLEKELNNQFEFESYERLEEYTRDLVEDIFQDSVSFISKWDKLYAFEDTFFTICEIGTGDSFNIHFSIVDENIEEGLGTSFILGR